MVELSWVTMTDLIVFLCIWGVFNCGILVGKRLLTKNIRTHRCLCVVTRWDPGVRRESFIQGPLCLKEDPCGSVSRKIRVAQGQARVWCERFCRGFFFSFRLPWNFVFYLMHKSVQIVTEGISHMSFVPLGLITDRRVLHETLDSRPVDQTLES